MQWCCGQPRPGVCVRSSRQMRHTRMLTPVRHPESGHAPMKPRLTVITIGVDDLEVSLRFYRDGLGFATEGIIGKEFEYGAVVFIELQSRSEEHRVVKEGGSTCSSRWSPAHEQQQQQK